MKPLDFQGRARFQYIAASAAKSGATSTWLTGKSGHDYIVRRDAVSAIKHLAGASALNDQIEVLHLSHGIVTLTGVVDSAMDRNVIYDRAMEVRNVFSVTNELQVQ